MRIDVHRFSTVRFTTAIPLPFYSFAVTLLTCDYIFSVAVLKETVQLLCVCGGISVYKRRCDIIGAAAYFCTRLYCYFIKLYPAP